MTASSPRRRSRCLPEAHRSSAVLVQSPGPARTAVFIQFVRVPINWPDPVPFEQLGERPIRDAAILQQVADTQGDAQVVFENVDVAVACPDETRPGNGRLHTAFRQDALAFRAVVGRIVKQVRREHTVGGDVPVVVDGERDSHCEDLKIRGGLPLSKFVDQTHRSVPSTPQRLGEGFHQHRAVRPRVSTAPHWTTITRSSSVCRHFQAAEL